MRTTKAALVAAMLAGALARGGVAVSAQSADQDMPGSGSCLATMHEMMALMGEHMGSPMMGQGSEPGATEVRHFAIVTNDQETPGGDSVGLGRSQDGSGPSEVAGSSIPTAKGV